MSASTHGPSLFLIACHAVATSADGLRSGLYFSERSDGTPDLAIADLLALELAEWMHDAPTMMGQALPVEAGKVNVLKEEPNSWHAQNAYAERFVRSIKQECLNRVIPLGGVPRIWWTPISDASAPLLACATALSQATPR